jgi:hypothetical protein
MIESEIFSLIFLLSILDGNPLLFSPKSNIAIFKIKQEINDCLVPRWLSIHLLT